jgi:hypothetical protein
MSPPKESEEGIISEGIDQSEIRRFFDVDFGRPQQIPGLWDEHSDDETSEAMAYLRGVR